MSRKEVIVFLRIAGLVLNLAIHKIWSKLNYLPFPERTWLLKCYPELYMVCARCEFNSTKY